MKPPAYVLIALIAFNASCRSTAQHSAAELYTQEREEATLQLIRESEQRRRRDDEGRRAAIKGAQIENLTPIADPPRASVSQELNDMFLRNAEISALEGIRNSLLFR